MSAGGVFLGAGAGLGQPVGVGPVSTLLPPKVSRPTIAAQSRGSVNVRAVLSRQAVKDPLGGVGLHGTWLKTNLGLVRDLAQKDDLGRFYRTSCCYPTHGAILSSLI